MKYRLLLTDRKNGRETELTVPAGVPLEELSARIKVAFGLPYCDHGWHRFLANCTTYVIDEHLVAEEEIRYECDLPVGRYRSSERTRLDRVFTVLGSAVTYEQDGHSGDHKVRCTLMERIP